MFLVLGAALVPVVAALTVLSGLIKFAPHTRLWVGLSMAAAVAVVALFFSGRWALKQLMRGRNDLLGYLGERAVGEVLLPLSGQGYSVFHDVPAENGKAKFNIDHVVVGRREFMRSKRRLGAKVGHDLATRLTKLPTMVSDSRGRGLTTISVSRNRRTALGGSAIG